MTFLANSNSVLQVFHAKAFKTRYTLCQYNIILSKDNDKYAFMCGSNFNETDVKLKWLIFSLQIMIWLDKVAFSSKKSHVIQQVAVVDFKNVNHHSFSWPMDKSEPNRWWHVSLPKSCWWNTFFPEQEKWQQFDWRILVAMG